MHTSFMTWVCPDWEEGRIREFAARSAFDGVEIRIDADHAHGIEPDLPGPERAEVRERFAADGVDIPAVATSAELAAADPDDRRAALEHATAAADLAGDLGAEYIRVFAGGDRGEMTPEAAADTAAALTELGEAAADHGVRPVLETMHDIVASPADALAVLDRVETGNVALLWNRPTIDRAALDAIGDRIEHVHLHDPVLDSEFEGVTDLIGRLAEVGYDGALSLEVIRGETLPEEQLAATADRLAADVEATR